MGDENNSTMSDIRNEDPTLYDVLDNFVNSRISGMNISLPGIVESYDKTKNTCVVKPAIKKVYDNGDVVELPLIENVPVMFQQTVNSIISLPIKKGDGVVLIFMQRSIDDWKSTGGIIEPSDTRKFDLSDAIAIPGLFGLNEGLSGDDEAIVIKSNDSKIRIEGTSEVNINQGTKGVARLDDTTIANAATDPSFEAFRIAFNAWGLTVVPPLPSPMPATRASKIDSASGTVKAGN